MLMLTLQRKLAPGSFCGPGCGFKAAKKEEKKATIALTTK